MDAADLWGRTFLATALAEHGQTRPLVPGSELRLAFEDGNLHAYAGCNHLSGGARFDGDRLTVAPAASTQMFCGPPLQEQEAWLTRFLAAGPTCRLDGDELVLSTGDAEIHLTDRRTAQPNRPVRGTRWVVDGIVDGDSVTSVPAGAQAYLTIRDDGRIDGFTGCNQFGGTATDQDGQVAFAEVFATRMACAEEIGRLESAVLSVLDGAVDAHVDGDRLTLTHPGGRGLRLRAA